MAWRAEKDTAGILKSAVMCFTELQENIPSPFPCPLYWLSNYTGRKRLQTEREQ